MSSKAPKWAEHLRKHFSGPMTKDDVQFLRDIRGFIEFAIRNGLSFPMVVSAIDHDLNEIMREGFDLKQAKARGFLPKVTGASKLSEEDFGESDEPLK